MQIIINNKIEYEEIFHRVVNGFLLDVIKENEHELNNGQIDLCYGKVNDGNVLIVLDVDDKIPSFKVYEPENYKPHIAGSSNSEIYDNLEDAYNDFLCRVTGKDS